MNIVTIIGTRPQYIKIKPLCDYFKKQKINNYLVDTNQHYSDNVSKNLVKELELDIYKNLEIDTSNEINFISNGISVIYKFLSEFKNKIDFLIVIGDTNSTLISSIVAKKMGIKLVHIEAGVRCYNKNRPEEINRMLVDDVSDIHFISRKKDAENVSNPIYIGDLEYNYLNSIEKEFKEDIVYDDPIIMTIHRQENLNIRKINKIFKFCDKIKLPVIFPIHHRTEKFIKENNITISKNITTIEPLTYKQMILFLRRCRGVISDSGGIVKTIPFFGKKCIVPSEDVEWNEVINCGYATNKLDNNWFNDCKIKRDKNFYYKEDSCEIIEKTLKKYFY